MVQARIHRGQIETLEPLPSDWEGQWVKILPLTPDDPILDLEERLTTLARLGPVEYEEGERDEIERGLKEMDQLGKEALNRLAGS